MAKSDVVAVLKDMQLQMIKQCNSLQLLMKSQTKSLNYMLQQFQAKVDTQRKLPEVYQTTTVVDYLSIFEDLMNKEAWISEPLKINCFIFGLKQELHRELLCNRPTTLEEAFAAVRAYEKRVEGNKSVCTKRLHRKVKPTCYSIPRLYNNSASNAPGESEGSSDTLIDVITGFDIHLHMPLLTSELDNDNDRKVHIIITEVVGFVSICSFIFITWCWIVKKERDKTEDIRTFEAGEMFSTDSKAVVLKHEPKIIKIADLILFSFELLANTTQKFHANNLFGRGGFDFVYKGNLSNGKEIAMKILSSASRQGTQEFMNEVIVLGDFSIEDDVLNMLIGSVYDPFFRFVFEKENLPTLLALIDLNVNLL